MHNLFSQPIVRRLWRRVAAPGAVLAGGLVGSAGRALIGLALPTGSGKFPVATLIVNLAGSLLLGFYLVRRQRSIVARWSLHFWAIGALGSFTTFSTFSVETVRLIDSGSALLGACYVLASMVGGLSAAVLGGRIARVSR